MKYIKYFESSESFYPLRTISEIDKYGKRLGSFRVPKYDYIEMSDDEILNILDKCENKLWNKEEALKKIKIDDSVNNAIKLTVGNPYGGDRLIVGKMVDEWYYVNVQISGSFYIEDFVEYYVCDQLHGLIECIDYLCKRYEKKLITDQLWGVK